MRHYTPNTKEVRTVDDKLLAKFDSPFLNNTLRLPERDEYANMDMEKGNFFQERKEPYLSNIDKYWLKVPKKGKNQISMNSQRSSFKEDITDITSGK